MGNMCTEGLAPSAAREGGPITDAFPSLHVCAGSALALTRARKGGERNVKTLTGPSADICFLLQLKRDLGRLG